MSSANKERPFVGVQTPAFSVYEEGPEHYLDVLQKAAGANAAFVLPSSSPQFMEADKKSRPDHYKEITPYSKAIEPPHDPAYYRFTRMPQPDPAEGAQTEERDVYEDLIEPARRRGMKLYARMNEGYRFSPRHTQYPNISMISSYGGRVQLACLNNPDWTGYLEAQVNELITKHPYLDGFNYLQERSGPLTQVLGQRRAHEAVPHCFCEHCSRIGYDRGVDVEQAKRGWNELHRLSVDAHNGELPPDGFFITFFRLLVDYPEILAWEKLFWDSLHNHRARLYGILKMKKPSIDVGWHLHQGIATQIPIRAMLDYRRIAAYSDHVKPVIYPRCLGYRTGNQWINASFKSLFADLRTETALSFMHDILGLNPEVVPHADEYEAGTEDQKGFGVEHVIRETERAVAGVAGKAKVYAGVGFDIPGGEDTPDGVYSYARAALDHGADGLLVSREYHEMKIEHLEAVGRAVREAST